MEMKEAAGRSSSPDGKGRRLLPCVRRRRLWVGLLFVLAASVFVWSNHRKYLFWTSRTTDASATVQVGEIVPDVKLRTLEDEPVSLSSFRGRAVMLEFWASWCGPCALRFDELERVEARLSPFQPLAINVGEGSKIVHSYVHSRGIKTQVLLDKRQRLSRLLGIEVLPATVFLDPDGRLILRHLGGNGRLLDLAREARGELSP